MSTNAAALRGRLSGFGVRVWLAILVGSRSCIFARQLRATRHYLQGQENSARALTAELQVLSQQLAKYAREAVEGGNAEAFDEFKATKTQHRRDRRGAAHGSAVEGVPRLRGQHPNEPGVSNALEQGHRRPGPRWPSDADRIIKSRRPDRQPQRHRRTASTPASRRSPPASTRWCARCPTPARRPRRSTWPTARSCSPTACRAA